MKSSIPMPVVVIAIVAVLAVIGFFVWRGGGSTASNEDIKNMATKEMNQGKPQTEAVPPEQAQEGALLMGGKKGGGGR